MDSFIYSLNATVPVFLVMIIGNFLHRIGMIDKHFSNIADKFVFKVCLPCMLFSSLSATNIRKHFDGAFIGFCFLATLISVISIWVLAKLLLKDKTMVGSFVQCSYRSSAAILGIAFIQNIYGNAGMAPVMIIGSVPLYNIMAVVVLSFFKPGQSKIDKEVLKKTLKGIITNPIIIGIVIGLLWSACRLPFSGIPAKTVTSIGNMATPMGLMAMGATFDIHKAFAKAKPSIVAAVMKLVGFAAVFLPIAVGLGFKNEEIVAILVMLGSATTVSSYVMAKNMGHEGVLTASTVMLTTMFSAFTLTGWLYILKTLGIV